MNLYTSRKKSDKITPSIDQNYWFKNLNTSTVKKPINFFKVPKDHDVIKFGY